MAWWSVERRLAYRPAPSAWTALLGQPGWWLFEGRELAAEPARPGVRRPGGLRRATWFWKPSAADGGADVGEGVVGGGAQVGDGDDAHHDDQGQHHRVLHSRRAVFVPHERHQ